MGLIKAAVGAIGGTLADQWKEFFYCESLSKDVLMVKGQKRTTSRSSNTKGNDNIITNGSGIAVADGQCMIIVEQGKVVDICADPGEYTYDKSTEPSIFAGSLGKSIVDTFKVMGKRFTYGGDTGKDQRVYYFNIKEIIDNKFGTATPILFRVVDNKIGLDLDCKLRCSGVYSFKIADPIVFYTEICGNVSSEFRREELDGQLKSEFISALQPALAKLSELEIRPNQIMNHTTELEDALNVALTNKWGKLRGLKVVSVSLSSVSLPDDQEQEILKAQRRGMLRDAGMAGAAIVDAQTESMVGAANNPNGAVNGFVGLGMGNNMAGMANAQSYYAMAAENKAKEAPKDGWKCTCGHINTGKFCSECGKAKPESDTWQCSCGKVNTGKFCSECGAKKPISVCPNCGYKPQGAAPKFCPECGKPFNA